MALKTRRPRRSQRANPGRTAAARCLVAIEEGAFAEEALARLPECRVDAAVETPCGSLSKGTLEGVPDSQICLVDIMRSGAILQEAVRKVVPAAGARVV